MMPIKHFPFCNAFANIDPKKRRTVDIGKNPKQWLHMGIFKKFSKYQNIQKKFKIISIIWVKLQMCKSKVDLVDFFARV